MARPVGEALTQRSRKKAPAGVEAATSGDAGDIRKVTTYATREDWRRWRAWAVEGDTNVSSLVLAAVRLIETDTALRERAGEAARRIDDERARGRS